MKGHRFHSQEVGLGKSDSESEQTAAVVLVSQAFKVWASATLEQFAPDLNTVCVYLRAQLFFPSFFLNR